MNNIPFVVDNQRYNMGDTLNKLLQEYRGKSLDIASAYFNVGGWQVLAEGLSALGSVRLLLGDEPEVGTDIGLCEVGSKPVKGLIRDLSKELNLVHRANLQAKEINQALQYLKGPLPGVYLKVLRKAYEAFLLDHQIKDLLIAVQALGASMQGVADETAQAVQARGRKDLLKREDLRLICFDYIWH